MAVDPVWLARQFAQLTDFRELGKGGQKEVFSAKDVVTGQTVVLKLFHATADPERAVRELRAVAGLDGNRVPRIVDVGTADSNVGTHVWFLEQFIDGQTLEVLLRAGSPSGARIRAWAEQLLSTLMAAEATGIVHRDIKPANVIIDGSDDAWLIDFGIARHLGLESVTPTSAPIGPHSPGYAPPEQFANSKQEVDVRTDLFALGVTLFECMEGRNPYLEGAVSPNEVLQRVASTDLPAAAVRDSMSAEFVDLIQSMTRRRKSQRPASASEALDWLQDS